MNVDFVRDLCLSFPHTTEEITWGADLTFRIQKKIFAVTVLEPAPVWLSFKCSPENFAELTERAGIIPAPYMARAKWVALETKDALRPDELRQLLRESYNMVFAGLPKKTQLKLASTIGRLPSPGSRASAKKFAKGKGRKVRRKAAP
jgi:predicted DNA-binding protein (MmcQ/YjbR family)